MVGQEEAMADHRCGRETSNRTGVELELYDAKCGQDKLK